MLANNSTSLKWLKILYQDIYVNKCTWNNDRYVGFSTNPLDKKKMSEELNHLISICEKERPGHFNFIAHENMSQDDFNRMHVWFETYRGELNNPHDFFISGTKKFKDAIERFNQLIHMWEKLDRYDKNDGMSISTFDVYGGNIERLEEEDMSNFILKKTDNTIYLSYIMRGKNLIDIWTDSDHHVGDDNIRPYMFLGSNFFLSTKGWGKEETDKNTKDFNSWFERNSNFLNSLGFYRDDPKCTIGWLPLAYSTLPEIKSIIEPRQYLKCIKIFEDMNDNNK